jgi:hypothetical protein
LSMAQPEQDSLLFKRLHPKGHPAKIPPYPVARPGGG